jgi:hypothetical protein
MQTEGEMEVWLHTFLISATDKGQLCAAASLPLKKDPPGIHWIGSLVDARASLDILTKILPCWE